MILAVDAMEDGEYSRHHGGSYEAGGNGRAAFLPCDLFLHQPNVSLLLLDGAALRTQRGFEDVILRIEHAETMHFRCYAGVI